MTKYIFNLLADEDLEGASFLDVPDTVFISGAVYPKTPAAHEALLTRLIGAGYGLNPAKDIARLSDSINGYMCDHCDGIFETSDGLGRHDHACGHCNMPTALRYNRDEYIVFKFVRNMVAQGDTIAFRIYDYDAGARELLLYADPVLEPNSKLKKFGIFQIDNVKEAHGLMESVADLYRRCIKFDKQNEQINLIAIHHDDSGQLDQGSVINPVEITGEQIFFTFIKTIDGQVYHGLGNLPVPDILTINSSYIGQKLSLSDPAAHEVIMRAAGQTPRADTYRQGGAPDFHDLHFRRWDAFIKHFVDVPYDEWKKFRGVAPHDGPGFINALAKWCALMSDGQPRLVRDDPNFMNAIDAAAKQAGGETLNYAEGAAAADGVIALGQLFGQEVRAEDIAERGIYRSVVDVMSKTGTPLGNLQKIRRKKGAPGPG